MSERHDLGAAIVLSPKDMHVGQYLEIDRQIFKVSKLVGSEVGLQPVFGIEAIFYKFKTLLTKYKIL